MENEGDRHVARFLLQIEQEVRMQVYLAVILDVEAGARLEIGQVLGVGQLEREVLADPGPYFVAGRHQVDPDRLQAGQLVRAVHLNLAQAAVMQLEGVQHVLASLEVARADQHQADIVGNQRQHAVADVFVNLVPNQQAVVLGQRFDDRGDFGRGQASEKAVQFDQVLLVYEIFNQVVARHFLSVQQVLDQPVARQQAMHLCQVRRFDSLADLGLGHRACPGKRPHSTRWQSS